MLPNLIAEKPVFSKKNQTNVAVEFLKSLKEKEGEISNLEVYVKIKHLENIFDNIKKNKDFLKEVHKEAYEYKGDSFNGVEVTLVNGKPSYTYDNDLKWRQYKEELEKISSEIEEKEREFKETIKSLLEKRSNLEKEISAREAYMRSITATVTDEQDGTVIAEPAKVTSLGSETLRITFPKELNLEGE